MSPQRAPSGPWPATAPGGPSLVARHPGILPIAAVLLAWVFLVITRHVEFGVETGPDGLPGAGHTGPHTGAGVHTVTEPAAAAEPGIPTPPAAVGHGGVSVAVMTIAMMGLLAIPAVRTAAFTSHWLRGGRAAVVVFGAFCATWIAITAGLHTIATFATPLVAAPIAAAGLLIICALVQLHPLRATLAQRCDLPQRIRLSGWAATVDSTRFGAVTAGRCARLCAVPMVAMLTLPASLPLMAALTVIVSADRIWGGRRVLPVAAAYAALGAAVLLG